MHSHCLERQTVSANTSPRLDLSYFFPLEVQLAEDILSVLVPGLSRLRQIIYRLGDILNSPELFHLRERRRILSCSE